MNTNLAADLRQFTGSEHWYRHALVPGITFTDGVHYLADKAECFWLLDKVATNQLRPEIRREEFQVWKLRVADDKTAMLTAEDGNGNEIHSEKLDWTDFPLSEIDLWFTDNVILLPSEY